MRLGNNSSCVRGALVHHKLHSRSALFFNIKEYAQSFYVGEKGGMAQIIAGGISKTHEQAA